MGEATSSLIGLIGLAVTLASGWYIVRGPFFGLETPPPNYILAACGVFVVAIYVFAWGFEGVYRERASDRPEPDEEQNQTLDMGFGPR